MSEFVKSLMNPNIAIEHQITCLLLASKLIEIDDNLILLKHLRDYVAKSLDRTADRDSILVPTFESVVECERRLCEHFKWNLNFILPINFLHMMLA